MAVTLHENVKHILVVEDEEELRHMYCDLMRNENSKGFPYILHPIECRDAVDALRKLENQEFAAIVTDYRVPRMRGPELLLELRNHPNAQTATLFLVSGVAGADELNNIPNSISFPKPLPKKEFLEALHHSLVHRAEGNKT